MTRPIACARSLLAMLAVSCGPGTAPREQVEPRPQPPLLPRGGPADPSLTELRAVAGTSDGMTLADVDTCGGCHPDVFAQQQVSAHAYSSFNNPIYRVAVDQLREAVGPRASRMCAGCHDIALMADGVMDATVTAKDTRAHAGVTCRVCHGITSARRDGNGSYTLAARPIVLPRQGDQASVAEHRRSVAPLRSAEMCGSCHRAFLNEATGNRGVFLVGQDDLAAWLGSPYNKSGLARVDDPIEARDCIGCHMPPERAARDAAARRDGVVSSHRFLGGHTWLAGMLGDEEQLARQRAFLRGAVSIDIAGARDGAGRRTLPADGAPITPGDTMELDVVLRNLRVGHRFPGGVMDAQDTWIEVAVRDARGRVLARAGGEQAASGDDASAHVLRALVADGQGRPRFVRETHEFRAPVVNHTLAPRDMVAVRYRLRVPQKLAPGPLAVEARVVHRSRNLPLQRAACRASRDARGRGFAARARELDDPVLDPCAAQPLTVLAETSVAIGPGARSRATRPAWRRLYEHGMALLHARQEELDDARAPLEAALAEVSRAAGAGPRERAMVLLGLGQLEGRMGRTAAAVAWLDRAEREMPGHPAIAYARGAAFARVWRWREAADAFTAAMHKAPGNAGGWGQLAMSLGSIEREREALDAARRGLALAPRDADLLRVQALALRGLGAAPDWSDSALHAYDQHRPPDQAADLRIACVGAVPLCASERDPVHVHELVPVR
jgi:Cytochrome c554 and c-prime